MVKRYLRCWLLTISGALLVACAATGPVEPRVPPATAASDSAAAPAPDTDVRIAAVGDIMLGGRTAGLLHRLGHQYPFAQTKPQLIAADLTVGNLETALTTRGEPYVDKKYLFRNPPEKVAEALYTAGFDIVSLANNHSMDYGVVGLQDTMAVLDQWGVRYHGAGLDNSQAREPEIFTLANGQTVGFLAYSNTFPKEFWATPTTPGTAFGHKAHIQADVAALLDQDVDIIVVSFHWGQERKTELRAYQPELAYAAIDAGADLVIGHHPHILQAVERYQEGLILYSLGNFTFSTYSNHVSSSALAEIEFSAGKFRELRLTPLNINNFDVQLQPQILQGAAAQAVFEELDRLSRVRNTHLKFIDNQIILGN